MGTSAWPLIELRFTDNSNHQTPIPPLSKYPPSCAWPWLETRQELFGSESEETASSYHNLGDVLEAIGDVEAAGEAFADGLSVRRRLGKDGEDAAGADTVPALFCHHLLIHAPVRTCRILHPVLTRCPLTVCS